jgi:hypothetical protein
MALVVFESRVNMLTVATPSVGGYVIAYDSADGVLKQKNDQGVISLIAGSSSPGSLAQTLAIGNSSGTHSINLGANCNIGSGMGGGQLRLDNGIGGANIVNLSTDYGALAQSYLYMSSNTTTLQSVNAGLSLTSTSSNLQVNSSNLISIRANNAFITLNSLRVLDFTTSITPSAVGNRINALISTSNSNFNKNVFNTVVLGGSGITGATSNSVYVPKLYVQDGGFVKGTAGAGQLTFTNGNEVFLSSNTTIIGILGTNSVDKTTDSNGIFIIDNADNITTTTITSNTFISTSNTTVNSGLNNVIVIGGDTLSITQSNTTYIGGSVSIGNSYILPSTDGTSGQVIKTDGSGNTYWGPVVGSLIEITVADFYALGGTFESGTTYKILDADSTLYGGTEIYLTTNASGVLNETGVGKFYNPKYDQTVSGFFVWSSSNSYSLDDYAFWGGRAWKNNSSTNFDPAIDLFTLDSNEWDLIPFDDPFSPFYYNVVYDEIKYDWENDFIIYRNEKNTNIVSSSVEDINYWINSLSGYTPIKVFQWGNVYDYSLYTGIGNNIITNSYNENINFRGFYQLNLNFNNGSYQSNLTFNNSYQSYLTFDNASGQNNLTFNNGSYQSNLTFDNGMQNNLTFDNTYQQFLTFNNSYQSNLTFDNSTQTKLTFNGSYQLNLTFDNSQQSNLTFNNSQQSNLTFDNTSYQLNLTFNNSYQDDLTFDNTSYQENLTFDNSYQENLTFDNASYQYNLTFNNTSSQYNLTFDNASFQTNLKFDNVSSQYDLTFDTNSHQGYLTFDNVSYQNNLMFDVSVYQSYLAFNSSHQSNLDFFTNCDQSYLTFNNNSYQEGLTFSYDGSQNNLTFNNSYQTQLIFLNNTQAYITLENSNQTNLEENQTNIKLENSNQTNLENSQSNLTLTGNNLSYQTPFNEADKGIGEVVFFGTASTLDPGYIYQFTTGEWKKADLASGASASGLLAIALGTVVSAGLLLRGYATFDLSSYSTMTLGSIQYLRDNGEFFETTTTTTGEIVRVIGYCVDHTGDNTLYFCPDTTWIEIV